jgi:predicted type IV restriction endonuclease
MRFFEFSNSKPLPQEQLRIKALKDQSERIQQTIKAEKARQKIKSGQQQLAKINAP